MLIRHLHPWRIALLATLLLLALVILLPLPDSFFRFRIRPSTRILDRNGQLLYALRHPEAGLQVQIPLAEIPQSCRDGIVAIEDRTFFTHAGVSARGIVRALWQNVTEGRIVSGGSTITQQLVRVLRGSAHRTFPGKALEALLALKLERQWSKDRILERYLNAVSFGHQAYGIAAAAQTYFGKSPAELSLAECALLTGLPQSPSRLDPFVNMPDARERQRRVLSALRETGDITESEEREAMHEPITLARDTVPIRAPHFVQWVIATHPEIDDSADVATTLDLTLQSDVERIVSRRLKELEKQNVTSAAVVILDAQNGDVLAMVGSADYFDREKDGQVNVALAARQPGSALKPFTYALALAGGATAATTVADTETQYSTQEGNPYVPRNYDYLEHGLVRYREALANSYNIAAVKVVERVGVANLLGFLRSAGVTTLNRSPEFYGLALTLGSGEVRLLELVQAYGIFPRGGQTLTPRSLLDESSAPGHSILDPRVAWLITDILSDNTARLPEFGADGPLTFDRPVAAKTGTTRNSRDNWTIGFTPDRIVGVWVGNADNTPMRDTSGITGAGPIFHEVMEAAVRNIPPKNFPRPAGIVDQKICALSGLLPSPLCPHTIEEHFIAGTEPTEPDNVYQSFLIDIRNGLLANKFCIQEFVERKAFAVFPKDTERWARENGWPVPPTRTSPLCKSFLNESSIPLPLPPEEDAFSSSSWIEILSPRDGDSFALDPLIPDSSERISLRAHTSMNIRFAKWFIDDRLIGTASAPDYTFTWKPTLGKHTVEIRSGTLRDRRTIEIVR